MNIKVIPCKEALLFYINFYAKENPYLLYIIYLLNKDLAMKLKNIHNLDLNNLDIEEDLILLASVFEEKFKEYFNRALPLFKKAFNIEKIPERLVVLAYPLLNEELLGLAKIIKGDPVIIIGLNEKEEKRIIAVFLHEILHILFELNNIELPPKFCEALLDYFVPNGLISLKLGLIDQNVFEYKIQSKLKRKSPRAKDDEYFYYFKNLLPLRNYDFSTDVWSWILKNVKDEKIKAIVKNLVKTEK